MIGGCGDDSEGGTVLWGDGHGRSSTWPARRWRGGTGPSAPPGNPDPEGGGHTLRGGEKMKQTTRVSDSTPPPPGGVAIEALDLMGSP